MVPIHGNPQISRGDLLGYFLKGACPREEWKVGMELEKMGRNAERSPLPYDGTGPSVRKVLELFRGVRGGDPVLEASNTIGLDSTWGTLSLEPGGQVEWSSRPRDTLAELGADLAEHLAVMKQAEEKLGMRWLDVALEPERKLSEMEWMPKARYKIMRSYLGERGRLAHRMMTQTTSIQCAFDYADPDDWKRKFRAGALLAPLATALFANSERLEGRDTGYRCYRQAIWRETDPARCGVPEIVFRPGFDIEAWLGWILSVPTLFLHRARGLVPAGGEPFAGLLERTGCEAVKLEDWETHVSTIFTEVRSYTYIEVRSADLQPDALALSVPTFWTGILYQDDALSAALDLCSRLDDHARWTDAIQASARQGLDARIDGATLGEMATRALEISASGLKNGAACAGDPAQAIVPLERLAARHGLDPSL